MDLTYIVLAFECMRINSMNHIQYEMHNRLDEIYKCCRNFPENFN